MVDRRIAARIAQLVEQRRPFVQATVVRAQCPTSARPGDAAVVFGDGAIEGFVGGQCAEDSVRAAALDVLDDGESMLLRVLPDDADEFPESPGSRTVVNPCLSGGALEIYLEPKLPAAEIVVVGRTPIADALVEFGQAMGFAMTADPDGEHAKSGSAGATAVLIASHGRSEESTITNALDAGVGFVGLVASQKRGAAVVESLDLDPEARACVHSPVGIWIGARTAEEIAISILADVVKAIRVDGLIAPKVDAVERPETAIDPVCGMTVTIVDTTPHLAHDGDDYWYCNPGCRDRHESDLRIG